MPEGVWCQQLEQKRVSMSVVRVITALRCTSTAFGHLSVCIFLELVHISVCACNFFGIFSCSGWRLGGLELSDGWRICADIRGDPQVWSAFEMSM